MTPVKGDSKLAVEEGWEPSWKKSFDESKEKARARTLALMENATLYPQPPRDPHIVWNKKEDRVTLVDTATGDTLVHVSAGREPETSAFRFQTGSGQVVRTFYTELGGGYHMPWDTLPIRVFATQDADAEGEAMEAARERMSLERLALFLAAHPMFSNDRARRFVIFETPDPPARI